MKINISIKPQNDCIIDLTELMISGNIDFVQSTFCSGSVVSDVRQYKKEYNEVEYWVGRWRHKYTMLADEYEDKYYIRH